MRDRGYEEGKKKEAEERRRRRGGVWGGWGGGLERRDGTKKVWARFIFFWPKF